MPEWWGFMWMILQMFMDYVMSVLAAGRTSYLVKICLFMARLRCGQHDAASSCERTCSNGRNLPLANLIV